MPVPLRKPKGFAAPSETKVFYRWPRFPVGIPWDSEGAGETRFTVASEKSGISLVRHRHILGLRSLFPPVPGVFKRFSLRWIDAYELDVMPHQPHVCLAWQRLQLNDASPFQSVQNSIQRPPRKREHGCQFFHCHRIFFQQITKHHRILRA